MATTTRRPSISALSQPMPVYIPSRQANGFPTQRRKASARQQATYTESQLQQPAQQKAYIVNDPVMHRKDVEYILSLFVAEQLECERLEAPKRRDSVSEDRTYEKAQTHTQ